MLAKLRTFSLCGIEAIPVDVEVDLSPSPLPKTVLVGLPDQAVRESTHRVERALVNSGFERPHDRVVINLAPAELPKQAASFDLPISLGMLVGSGQFASESLEHYAVVGELALEGHTRPVKGALSMAIAAAKQQGLRGILVPSGNASEAAVVEDIDVIPISSLSEAVAFFTGTVNIEAVPSRLQELFDATADTTSTLLTFEGNKQLNEHSSWRQRARTICLCSAHQDQAKLCSPKGCQRYCLR